MSEKTQKKSVPPTRTVISKMGRSAPQKITETRSAPLKTNTAATNPPKGKPTKTTSSKN